MYAKWTKGSVLVISMLAVFSSANAENHAVWYYCASETFDSSTIYYSAGFTADDEKLAEISLEWHRYLSSRFSNVRFNLRGGCLSNHQAQSVIEARNSRNAYIDQLRGSFTHNEIDTRWYYYSN